MGTSMFKDCSTLSVVITAIVALAAIMCTCALNSDMLASFDRTNLSQNKTLLELLWDLSQHHNDYFDNKVA